MHAAFVSGSETMASYDVMALSLVVVGILIVDHNVVTSNRTVWPYILSKFELYAIRLVCRLF